MPVRFICLALVTILLAQAEDGLREATGINNVAARLYAQGMFDQAERLYRAALAVPFDDDNARAKITSNLAALHKRLNRYPEAEGEYRLAIELRRKYFGPVHPEVAISMNNLSDIYRIQGRSWEASNLLQAAVQILEQADPESEDMAVLLNNLAVSERARGRYTSAEALLRRTLSLSESAYGPAARQVAIALNNLAQILEDKGEYENAHLFYSRAMAIFTSSGSAVDSAITLANLGRLCGSEQRYSEAEKAERDALELVMREPHIDGLLQSTILQNLANIRTAAGAAAQALGLFAQSLTLRETILGADHPAIAGLLGDYAEAALHAGKKSEAKKLRQRQRALLTLRRPEDFARLSVDIGELRSLR